VKGSSPAFFAGETLACAPFTCCAGACWSSGVLTGGADAEDGAGPPAELAGDPPFPGVFPDEPEFVVVAGVVVVVSDVVVVSTVVVVSVVGVVSVVVVVSQWSSLPLAFP
jgi:hypothetical protein